MTRSARKLVVIGLSCLLWTVAPPAQADGPAILRLTTAQRDVHGTGVDTVVDLSLRNDGPATATDVRLSGTLSGELGSLVATSDRWTCTADLALQGGKFSCEIKEIPADVTETVTVRLRPGSPRLPRITLELGLTAANLDPASVVPPGRIPVPVRGTPGGLAGTQSSLVSTATPQVAGWRSMTLPITLTEFPAAGGYRFARHFGFLARDDWAYLAVQPYPDGTMHVLFSIFGPGVEPAAPETCRTGTDGVEGATCELAGLPVARGHRYELTVTRDEPVDGKTTWRGTFRDAAAEPAREPIAIGAWKIDAASGDLNNNPGSFIGYYTDGVLCADLPPIDVTFGAPQAESATVRTIASDVGGACERDDRFWAETFEDGGARVKLGHVPDEPVPVPAR
ncbi:hypothetical protein AB5J62_14695 [Amycolatopsis sp. cg5]|uniref:hypothetical protein n=1 Tax=Amycolatopsis sp. cg5 TaxID=3238802 RepID=UPI0035231F0D